MINVIAYDIGTTGLKSCLFRIDHGVEMLGGEYATYDLFILDNGGAEQDTEQWWEAMCSSTKKLLKKTGVQASDIDGISFCSQMQGLILVDKDGNALRRPMSYMDQRAGKEMDATQKHGITIAGVNIGMLLKSLRLTSAASTSVKDPLWKYKWVEANEPEVFAKVYKWLDVKEYLICRATGEFVMTYDTAFSTFLYDTRKGHEGWSKSLCKMYGVNYEHLPRLVGCSEVVGGLTEKAAKELGLSAGIKVYGSGGDATLIGVGAGATELNDTHIYCGTSGWVGTVIDRQAVDLGAMIAGIVGAQDGKFTYFAEMETAGKCFEWVKDHLALDEIDIYLSKIDVKESVETEYVSLYDYLSNVISQVEPGSGGVIFTPWLHGNRCPFEDPKAAGIFFNIKLETGKSQMLRAVIEGICYHMRWMLECEARKVKISDTIRFVGGGSISETTCQILADILNHRIETVDYAKDVGALGAAMLVAVETGEIASLDHIKELVKVKKSFEPNPANRAVYDRGFEVFKKLYQSNKKNFAALN